MGDAANQVSSKNLWYIRDTELLYYLQAYIAPGEAVYPELNWAARSFSFLVLSPVPHGIIHFFF